jgi:hypothetical protein
MSRIAKGPLDSLFKNKRSRKIAKGDGLGLFGLKTRTWEKLLDVDVAAGVLGVCAGPENTVMRNPIDIDSSHSRAIVREIGERLRASFEEDRELPTSFRIQIEQLRKSDESQNVPLK